MKKRRILIPFLSLGLLAALVGCSANSTSSTTSDINNGGMINPVNNNQASNNTSAGEAVTPSVTANDAEEDKVEIESDFVIETEDGSFVLENGVYKITSPGVYTVSGKLEDGMIYIDTTGDVEIDLNGASISCSTNSPIYAINIDNLKIKSNENTYNEIIDNRLTSLTDTLGGAAIYAECDLKLVGKGSLYVSGLYNNGIHTKDDLSIKNVTLTVKAFDNALKGNDSITIESGEIKAISTGGDGIKTTNSDISSKGNQRGTVTISGGVLDIYACEDGIDSSYDVEISDTAVVNIYTSSYSSYSGAHSESSDTKNYIRVARSYYSSSYRYAAYLYNNDGTYKWVDLSYIGTSSTSTGNGNMPNQNRSSYYYYEFDLPSGYTNIAIYRFDSSNSENSTTTYSAKTSGGTINTNKNMYSITSISGTTMSGDWVTYSTGNNDYSAKGIKADNEINVLGGTINISSTDDAFHANYGNTLENGEIGLGNINIAGGNITVTSGDDGMHADGTLTIDDGYVNVVNSHEGLEGNQIIINGGATYVYANDDGVNATSGSKTTLLSVTGGLLDVTVGSGDTDGIDSNGSYSQSGGVVITRNPNSDKSGNMGALDIDSTFSMTGGTFIALGVVSKTPSNYNYVSFGAIASGFGGGMFGGQSQNSSSSLTLTKGTYTIENTNIEFTANTTYYSLFIASSELKSGNSYTLKGGTTKTWTQTSNQTTI